MGHTQFMPSAYSQYAIDGDHDGQVNLWKSKRDALGINVEAERKLYDMEERRTLTI